MNELKDYANIFEGIQPFTGPVSGGYLIDFLGTRTDANFRTMFGVEPASVGGGPVQTKAGSKPSIGSLPPARRGTVT
jgi:hypothetical protein